MSRHVNSAQYWENRFASGDWTDNRGEEQTRFFGRLALRLLPDWVRDDIRKHRRAVCDVGCAEGAATDVWASAFPDVAIAGVDFSAAAVARARALHPRLQFFQGDLDASPAETEVVFCSNVLEHLREPAEHLKRWASRPNIRHLIVLVPLHETNRHFEHVVTLDYNNFPLKLGSLLLSAFKEVDLRGTPDEAYWYGKQALVVYSHEDIAQQVESGLHDLLGPAMQARGDLEQAKKALAQAQAEQRLRLAELTQLQRRLADTLSDSRQTERDLSRTESELKALDLKRQREHDELSRRIAEAERAHGPLREALAESESRLALLNHEVHEMRSSLKWKVAFALADSAHHTGIGPLLRLWKIADTHGMRAALGHARVSARKRIDNLFRRTPHDFNPYDGLLLLKPTPVDVIDERYRGATDLPAFSVVTTVRNEAANLERFLSSIASQRLRPSEVVVVDGGSTDDTVDLLHEFADIAPFPVKVIAEGKCNIAAGRNRGLKQATHELILFVDAGCTLKADFFSSMIGPFTRSEEVDLVGGIYTASADATHANAFIADWSRCDFTHFLPSARALAVRRGITGAMGGFPEYLTHTGEDTLFDIEYRRMSRRWVFNRAAMVEWNGPANPKAQLKLNRSYARGDGESGLGDWRFYNLWSADRRGLLPPLNELDRAALDGYIEGRKLRAKAELERRSLRGVIVVFDEHPPSHRGGDHRLTQLALELTRQGFKVIHVSAAPPPSTPPKPVFLDIDPTRLELYQVNDVDLEEICERYGRRLMGIIVGSPHPVLVEQALELDRLMPQAPLFYDVEEELRGPGQPGWYRPSSERALVKHARLIMLASETLRELDTLRGARDVRVVNDGFDNLLYHRALAPQRPDAFPKGKVAMCLVPPGMELLSPWMEHAAIAHPDLTFLVVHQGPPHALPRSGRTFSNVRALPPLAGHELAAYLAHAQVALLPVRLPVSRTVAPSPTWLWQALAVGTPVVAPETLAQEAGFDGMWWVRDADEFSHAIGAALAAPAPGGSLTEALKRCTWQHRVHELLDAMFDCSRR